MDAENQRKRVLVVDDSEDLRVFMRLLLVEHGYDVVVASTGAQALELLREDAFDLLLLDLVIPDIAGVELIGRIRETNAALNIVVVSGYAGCLEQRRLSEMGVRRVMPKPFKTVDVLEAAHALTGRPRALMELWGQKAPGLMPEGTGASG